MKIILIAILTSAFAVSAQAASKCSEENLIAVLKLSSRLSVDLMTKNMTISRLIDDAADNKPQYPNFYVEYNKTAAPLTSKVIAASEKLNAFLAKNPECNIDGIFGPTKKK